MRFPGFGVHEVEWYWTDKGPLPYDTVYSSHNHIREEGDDDGDTGEAGEVWGAPRTHYSGNPLPGYPCKGPFGSEAAWLGQTDSSSPSILVPSVIPFLGRGGMAWGGNGYHPWHLPSGIAWGGSVGVGPWPRGGLSFGGSGRQVSGNTHGGGTAWGGTGRQVAVGNGGTRFGGSGRQGSTGTGGEAWGGSGRQSLIGSGGLSWDGSGQEIVLGSGGIAWNGTGQMVSLGSGGLLYDGSGLRLAVGSGGIEFDGSGVRLAVGSGGTKWDGSGIEGPVQTFSCGAQVAAGSTQGTATLITFDTVSATSTGVNQGLILPAGCYRVVVRNNNSPGGNAITVYPPAGANIAGGSTNAGVLIGANSSAGFIEITATHWATFAVSV